jgi:hypothetical protein
MDCVLCCLGHDHGHGAATVGAVRRTQRRRAGCEKNALGGKNGGLLFLPCFLVELRWILA